MRGVHIDEFHLRCWCLRCLLGPQEDPFSVPFNMGSRTHQGPREKTQLGFLSVESNIITKATGIDDSVIQKWEE